MKALIEKARGAVGKFVNNPWECVREHPKVAAALGALAIGATAVLGPGGCGGNIGSEHDNTDPTRGLAYDSEGGVVAVCYEDALHSVNPFIESWEKSYDVLHGPFIDDSIYNPCKGKKDGVDFSSTEDGVVSACLNVDREDGTKSVDVAISQIADDAERGMISFFTDTSKKTCEERGR